MQYPRFVNAAAQSRRGSSHALRFWQHSAAGRGISCHYKFLESEMQTRALVDKLGLEPHPEGGWYREIYRSSERVQTPRGSRAAITMIYYVLERNQVSRWHVVAADEIWHFYEGSPLELLAYDPDASALARSLLGGTGEDHERVAVIRKGIWQAARSLGDFSLVGCSVGPGFEFEDFRFVADLPGHRAHFKGELVRFASWL
jgi:uncharacterized protein